MTPTASRSLDIDVIKGVACALIVLHHLAFYGPMSDIAQPLAPALMAWLYEYGRLAVQVFLVLGGYLAARSLAPRPSRAEVVAPSIAHLLTRRYLRLVVPLSVALLVAVLLSGLVRPWLNHPSVPGEPTLVQLLANMLLLQDLVGQEALSAGVWYVAIDFQLYLLAVLLLHGAGRHPQWARWVPWLVGALMAVSLLGFNRQPDWDVWALYFWGSYGMGIVAAWAVQAWNQGRRLQAQAWVLALALLVAGALALDFRIRIAVAFGAAVVLIALGCRAATGASGLWARALAWLGLRSYSVFLIHFAISLPVNALVTGLWPQAPWPNLLGMGLSFGLSILAGWLLYEKVERPLPTWGTALRWQAGLLGMGLLTAGLTP